MSTQVSRGLLTPAAVLVVVVLSLAQASAEGTLTGDLPRTASGGGVALVHWTGGPIDDLADIVGLEGCDLRSVWVAVDGELFGYFVGAPPFVNVDWLTVVGEPEVEAGPLLLRCTTPELGSCVENETTLEYPTDTPGFATIEEAVRSGVASLPDVPAGILVAVTGAELDPGGFEKAEWRLLTVEGVPIGKFVAVRGDLGWLLSTARVCVFT